MAVTVLREINDQSLNQANDNMEYFGGERCGKEAGKGYQC